MNTEEKNQQQTSEAQLFNVLGHKVRFKPDELSSEEARIVVEQVNQTASAIKSKMHGLSEEKTAILVALSMGAKWQRRQNAFDNELQDVEESIQQALEFIDSVAPEKRRDTAVSH